jgi:hypothetical protein
VFYCLLVIGSVAAERILGNCRNGTLYDSPQVSVLTRTFKQSNVDNSKINSDEAATIKLGSLLRDIDLGQLAGNPSAINTNDQRHMNGMGFNNTQGHQESSAIPSGNISDDTRRSASQQVMLRVTG